MQSDQKSVSWRAFSAFSTFSAFSVSNLTADSSLLILKDFVKYRCQFLVCFAVSFAFLSYKTSESDASIKKLYKMQRLIECVSKVFNIFPSGKSSLTSKRNQTVKLKNGKAKMESVEEFCETETGVSFNLVTELTTAPITSAGATSTTVVSKLHKQRAQQQSNCEIILNELGDRCIQSVNSATIFSILSTKLAPEAIMMQPVLRYFWQAMTI
jgi:hypothetical protein